MMRKAYTLGARAFSTASKQISEYIRGGPKDSSRNPLFLPRSFRDAFYENFRLTSKVYAVSHFGIFRTRRPHAILEAEDQRQG